MRNKVNVACGAVNAAIFRSQSLAAVLLTLLAVKSVPAIEVSFFEVPGPANAQSIGGLAGLSADGRFLLVDYRGTNNESTTIAFSIGQTIEPLTLNFQGAFFDISGDGSFLAGAFGGSTAKWRRIDGARTILPGSYANGLSYDGQIVVGSLGAGTSALEAFRWSEQNGLQLLGDLQGRSRLKGSISVDSQATGVSSDGSVVIGVSSIASGLEGAFTGAMKLA